MNRFEYRDASGDRLIVLPAKGGILIEAEHAPHVPLDQVEEVVAGIRDMARQAGGQPTRDCPACEAGIEHTEHCPTPETHNWGCGCPTDQQPVPRRLTEAEHDRAWHAIEGAAGEDGADPGTVLAAVLRALDIDPPARPLPGAPLTADQLAAESSVLPDNAVITAEALRNIARQAGDSGPEQCTCGSAGPEFVPAGHYQDCPQHEDHAPAAEEAGA
ncbi:hypothetical protein [Streptomyces goshikiensis]